MGVSGQDFAFGKSFCKDGVAESLADSFFDIVSVEENIGCSFSACLSHQRDKTSVAESMVAVKRKFQMGDTGFEREHLGIFHLAKRGGSAGDELVSGFG